MSRKIILLLLLLTLYLHGPSGVLKANTTNDATDRWIDVVGEFSLGSGTDDDASSVDDLVGPPDYNGSLSAHDDRTVSLGDGGYVIAYFTNNVVVNGLGKDLMIHETFGFDEAQIFVASGDDNFVLLGTATGSVSFDIAGTGLSYVDRVKIVDTGKTDNPPTTGYDVDAIEAVHSAAEIPDPNAADRWVDAVGDFGLGTGIDDDATAVKHILGPPDYNKSLSPLLDRTLSLGVGGFVVGIFIDNVVVDGPGNDLKIHESLGGDEAQIFAAAGEGSFVLLGTVTGSASFDLSGTGLSFVDRVKIVDTGNHDNSPTAGFDVDAIEALNWQPRYIAIATHSGVGRSSVPVAIALAGDLNDWDFGAINAMGHFTPSWQIRQPPLDGGIYRLGFRNRFGPSVIIPIDDPRVSVESWREQPDGTFRTLGITLDADGDGAPEMDVTLQVKNLDDSLEPVHMEGGL